MTGFRRLTLRALLTWALEAAALALMLRYLPGVTVTNWRAAAASGDGRA